MGKSMCRLRDGMVELLFSDGCRAEQGDRRLVTAAKPLEGMCVRSLCP